MAISTACSQKILTVASPVHKSLTLDFFLHMEGKNIKYISMSSPIKYAYKQKMRQILQGTTLQL
jgi:hypothetical protein